MLDQSNTFSNFLQAHTRQVVVIVSRVIVMIVWQISQYFTSWSKWAALIKRFYWKHFTIFLLSTRSQRGTMQCWPNRGERSGFMSCSRLLWTGGARDWTALPAELQIPPWWLIDAHSSPGSFLCTSHMPPWQYSHPLNFSCSIRLISCCPLRCCWQDRQLTVGLMSDGNT